MSEMYIDPRVSEDTGLLHENAKRLARAIGGTLVTSGFRGRLHGLQIISASLGEGELKRMWLQIQDGEAGGSFEGSHDAKTERIRSVESLEVNK